MINIVSPINQLGYGITGLNIVKSLSKLTSVALWPIGQPQVTTQEDSDIISECIRNNQMPDFNAPCIKIWHQHDMTQFVGDGVKAGFPIFELDRFNKVEKHHLNYLDHIFVCSEWAKNVILYNLNIDQSKITVIPLGVDLDIFKPSEFPKNCETTRFFNCGKWEIRKGHDVLVEVFNTAFDIKDDVELVLMCENPFYTPEESKKWEDLYKNSKLGDKITIIPRQPTQQQVYNIMKDMHCGIFPSRAEGWNLELLEMMACGKPVITTKYSAHTEFCNETNSTLIPIDKYEPAYDNKWFHGQGNWAKLGQHQKDLMAQAMRDIHKSRQSSTLQINRSGIQTANNFTWSNSAKKIIQSIQQ
jgi:glycosyltransferase involved in cell wall biosynthesis